MQNSDDGCSLLQWFSLAPRSMSATDERVYMPPGYTLYIARPIIAELWVETITHLSLRIQAACASAREGSFGDPGRNTVDKSAM
jgi:hypothetical protein